MLKFSPSAKWDPQVHHYLESALGAARFEQVSAAMCRPALHTCLRVNTLRTTPQAVVQQLQQLFPGRQPYVHPAVDSAVIIPGSGPLPLDLDLCGGGEVIVNRLAGEAVLQGAHVFAPGLLAASSGLAEGDLVAVTVAVEQQQPGRRGSSWCGVNRGARVNPQLQAKLPEREQLCVGVGRVVAGRRELFRQQQGLAVEMVQRVFDVQPCNGVLQGQVLLQSLPCIVAAQALDPQPGSRVLDMCAAPGGKTSMLAQMMAGNSSSRLIALDRTAAKVQRVQQLSETWGVQESVTALVADATQLYQPSKLLQQQQEQQYQVLQPSQSWEVEGLQGAAVMPARSCGSGSANSSTTASCTDDVVNNICSPSTTNLQASDTSTPAHHHQITHHQQHHQQHNHQQQQPDLLSAQVLAAVQPNSFDAVLLDAPCSALGLRPRLLLSNWRLPQLQALAAYQRALLHSAVHVLKPGGSLVYCTCTINPGENEANVRYVLDKWPHMRLVEQPLQLGGPGLVGPQWLTKNEAPLVQRFDPAAAASGHSNADDTIGFFIAKFVKTV